MSYPVRNEDAVDEQILLDKTPAPGPRAEKMMVRLDGVTKSFVRDGKSVKALDNVDLQIPAGQFVSLIGPSGCGKSTILNLLAGLFGADGGRVQHDQVPVVGVNHRVGYVSQHDALLPWKSVAGNVEIPLKLRKVPSEKRARMVASILELMNLQSFAESYPAELSGGMRKRVALAQTLVYEPETLLMDEPFGPLDALLRIRLQEELLALWERNRSTVIFVTHDIAEAIALSDRIIVMTARPARVKLDVPIELARPRNVAMARSMPGYGDVYARVWDAVKEEVS